MSSAARPETPAEKYKGVYIAKDGTCNFVDRTGAVWIGLSPQSAKRRSLEVYHGKKKQSEPAKTTFNDEDEKMTTDPDAIELDLLVREDFVAPEETALPLHISATAAATSVRDIGASHHLLGSLDNHESHT